MSGKIEYVTVAGSPLEPRETERNFRAEIKARKLSLDQIEIIEALPVEGGMEIAFINNAATAPAPQRAPEPAPAEAPAPRPQSPAEPAQQPRPQQAPAPQPAAIGSAISRGMSCAPIGKPAAAAPPKRSHHKKKGGKGAKAAPISKAAKGSH
jgi:2-oxoglutarate dehydrogenase E2 component (dihydrolipoamide succinyltransferase)